MSITKGIILAGGTGSRLYPLTAILNKQLLPIYDKPLIYYPLTTLMLAGIKDILLISTPRDLDGLKRLLGDGSHLGLRFSYCVQENPNGLPEAFILGEDFIDNDPVAMILGDNIFHGQGLSEIVFKEAQSLQGAHIFIYAVEDPERYGIVSLDDQQRIIDIEEKPTQPKSKNAITGLYYFDGAVSMHARNLKPSPRGELEIVDLIRKYHELDQLTVTPFGRGYMWLDAGTPKSLLEASKYVEIIQSRQGTFIASPEEVAWRMGFIDDATFQSLWHHMPRCKYRDYLESISLV